MVLVALHHADRAVEVRHPPCGIIPQGHVRIVAHAVGLDVRLVDDVQAVLVGQLVPAGIVGIVGSADRVDVELLHQPDVLEHALVRHDVTGQRIVLVTIDPFDGDRNAVDEQLAVGDLHPTESDPRADHFDGRAIIID